MASWPLAKYFLVPVFTESGSLVIRVAGLEENFRIEAIDIPKRFGEFDAAIKVHPGWKYDRQDGTVIPLSFKDFVLAPIALFIALSMASRVDWRKKRRMALAAALPLSLFVVGRICLLVIGILVEKGLLKASISEGVWSVLLVDVLGLGDPSPRTVQGLGSWMTILFEPAFASCLFSLVLWGSLVKESDSVREHRGRRSASKPLSKKQTGSLFPERR